MPRLLVVALAFGVFTLVATGVAIARRLPYQFGGTVIVLAWVAGRRGWIGIAAAAVVALLGMVGIFAGLMEPALRTLDPLVTPIAVLGIGLAVLLVVSAVRAALTAIRNRRSTV
jgi:hypothetical protein